MSLEAQKEFNRFYRKLKGVSHMTDLSELECINTNCHYAERNYNKIVSQIKSYIASVKQAVEHNELHSDDEYIKGGMFVLGCVEDIISGKPFVHFDDED